MSPILDERHDFAHPVEADQAWSESYYFNAYDPGVDVGFFTRIAIRPNEGTMDAGLSVWLPGGGGLASRRAIRSQGEMVDDDLEVHGVRYERLAPMKQWRITADGDSDAGPLAVDVTFDALIPAIGTDGQGRTATGVSAQTAQTVGRGHLEQAGRWSGWIEVDGNRVELGPEARGNRDKSWGPRRWGGPRMWRWFSINVGDHVHFGGIRIGTPEGDLHRGWVWKDGRATSLRCWKIRTETEEDGVTQKVVHVTAVDKRDREHELRADLLRVARIPHGPNTLLNEGLARWTYEGDVGYGIAEYLHQLDDDGNPLVGIE